MLEQKGSQVNKILTNLESDVHKDSKKYLHLVMDKNLQFCYAYCINGAACRCEAILEILK